MIDARNLSVSNRKTTYLIQDISAQFSKGLCHIIVGPNGSGKTTFLKALCQLQHHVEGAIDIDGQSARDLNELELASKVSWTESEHHSPFAYTVKDIILWGRWPHHQGHPSQIDHDVVRQAAETMGLTDKLHRAVTTLSLGERKKTYLAKSIASDTPYMILDEPCGSLDIKASVELMQQLRQAAKSGKTIIMSLHDIDLALCFADTMTILKNGRLAWHGPNEDKNCRIALSHTFDMRLNETWGNPNKYQI
jgi:iron complex transport system ATP-binding protein